MMKSKLDTNMKFVKPIGLAWSISTNLILAQENCYLDLLEIEFFLSSLIF